MARIAYALENAPPSGVVYHDQNLNGVRDPNEPGIANVRVTAFGISISPLATAQTDAQGQFTLTLTNSAPVRIEFTDYDSAFGLGNGMRNVRFINNPLAGNLNLALNKWDDYCAPAIPTTACAAVPVRVSGRIWLDGNANGLQDPGESAMSGVTARLFDERNTLVATTLTTADGLYAFSGATSGNYGADGLPNTGDDENLPGLKPSSNGKVHTYTLRLDNASDYAIGGALEGFGITQSNTPSGEHGELRDSDAVIDNKFPQLTFVTGQPSEVLSGYDMGLFRASAIGGLAWLDGQRTGDGVRGPAEAMLPGVSIELYNDSNSLIATSTSRGNGIYRFSGLLAGRYTVRFVAPLGYTFTAPFSGPDSTLNSDASLPLGYTTAFTLSAGKAITSIDVGLVQFPAELNVRVFVNNLATDDVGPSLMGGNLITWSYVISNTGMVTLTKVGVKDENVADITCPSKTLPPNAQLICTAQQRTLVGNYSSRVMVSAINSSMLTGDNALSYSLLANYRGTAPASINGRIWFDVNRDSIKTGGELSVPEIVVSLYRMNGGNAEVVMTRTANNDGLYGFGSLSPGAYRIGLALPSELGLAVTGNGNDEATNNDFDPASAQTAVFNLSEGQTLSNIDAGIWALQPYLGLALYANQQDGGIPPGVLALADKPLDYTYVVLNLGTGPLSQIVVSDTVSGPVLCPRSSSLQPGQQLVCQATLSAVKSKGQNSAMVSALAVSNGVTRELIATDQAYYSTGSPRLVMRQSSLPINNTPVVNNTVITYTIAISNAGTFTASNITLENLIAPGTALLIETIVPSATNAASVFNSRGVLPLRWILPALGPSQSTLIQFATRVSAALNGSLSAIVQDSANAQSMDMDRQTMGNLLVHPFLPTGLDDSASADPLVPVGTVMDVIENAASGTLPMTTPLPLPLPMLVGGGNPIAPGAIRTTVQTVHIEPILPVPTAIPALQVQPIATAIVEPSNPLPLPSLAATASPQPPADRVLQAPTFMPTQPAATRPSEPTPAIVATSGANAPTSVPAVQVWPSITPQVHIARAKVVPRSRLAATLAPQPPAPHNLLTNGIGLLVIIGAATLIFGAILVFTMLWLKQ